MGDTAVGADGVDGVVRLRAETAPVEMTGVARVVADTQETKSAAASAGCSVTVAVFGATTGAVVGRALIVLAEGADGARRAGVVNVKAAESKMLAREGVRPLLALK